jgi:hypothetical protein
LAVFVNFLFCLKFEYIGKCVYGHQRRRWWWKNWIIASPDSLDIEMRHWADMTWLAFTFNEKIEVTVERSVNSRLQKVFFRCAIILCRMLHSDWHSKCNKKWNAATMFSLLCIIWWQWTWKKIVKWRIVQEIFVFFTTENVNVVADVEMLILYSKKT